MKKVIITGATSGIGRALAVEMHMRGYAIGATGRRKGRLLELEDELHHRIHIQQMDVTNVEEAREQLQQLISAMGGMDILVLNAGVSNLGGSNKWSREEQVIAVNVTGFSSLANAGFRYFKKQGHGQLVGISSIAAMFGYGRSAVYNASKAFVSNYLQGYRQKANHNRASITVTNIMPGFVESEITESMGQLFWEAPAPKAARQIASAIEKKKSRAYITRRWRLVAWLITLTPNWVLDRL